MLHYCLCPPGRAGPDASCTCVVVLCRRELLPQLLPVVRVQLIVEGGAEPFGLRLVEDGRHRVRDVNDASGFARNHEQEAIGRLQDEMLQLLGEAAAALLLLFSTLFFRICRSSWPLVPGR